MNVFNRSPFLKLLLPFLVGICCAYSSISVLTPHLLVLLGVISTLLILLVIAYLHPKFKQIGYSWVFGFVLYPLLFFLGVILTIVQNDRYQTDFYGQYFHSRKELLLVEVSEKPIEKDNWMKVYCKVKAVVTGKERHAAYGNSLVYLKKDKATKFVEYGDRLLVYGYFQKVLPPANPYAFDFEWFLGLANIYHQAFIDQGNWEYVDSKGGNYLKSSSIKIANYILNVYRKNGLSDQEFGVTAALVLGVRDELDPEILSAFSASGAMHVLSVSGLHVGMIFAALSFLLKFLEKLKKGLIIKSVLILLMLWFYALLTGLSPSVLRSTLMLTFMLVGTLIQRKGESFNVVCMSAFGLLLLDPYLVYNVGFQLSYAAVGGIVLWYRDLYNLIEFKNKFADWIWSLTCVSIVASVATFPLCIYYFNQFPNYFLLSNYLVIPISNMVIYSAIAVAFFSPIDFLAFWLTKLLYYFVWLLNHSVMFIKHLPNSQMEGLCITKLHVVLMYLVITFAVLLCYSYKKVYLKLTLVAFLLLVIADTTHTFLLVNKRQVIAYSLGKISALHFISGQKDLLIATDNLISNPKSMKFNIDPVRIHQNVNFQTNLPIEKNTLATDLPLYKKSGFIHFCGMNLLCLDKKVWVRKESKPYFRKIDGIVVRNNAMVKLEFLKQKLKFDFVIIDATNSFYKAKKVEEECNKLGIKAYNLSVSGAYIRDDL